MELRDAHLEALKAIAGSPTDADHFDPDILAELRSWGLVMPRTLELTGMGARLVGNSERGVPSMSSVTGLSLSRRQKRPPVLTFYDGQTVLANAGAQDRGVGTAPIFLYEAMGADPFELGPCVAAATEPSFTGEIRDRYNFNAQRVVGVYGGVGTVFDAETGDR